MRRVLFLAVIVACKSDEARDAHPPIPAPVTFASGGRLRATFQEVDGVRLFGGWMDTKLGKPCSFNWGRCLPGTTRLEQESLALFDDDACSSRIAISAAESAFNPPFDTIAYTNGGAACATATIHARGDAVTPARVFRRNAAGACEEAPAGGEFVRIGPALGPDDTTFVRAKEENDASGGRIVARWLVAEDGARQLLGAWDTERNEPVARPSDTSGKRWYPARRATLIGERCPGLATSFDCEPKVVISATGACRPPDIYALGPPADASMCGSGPSPGFQVLSSIPTQTFADATAVDVGAGRVRLRMDARGDGAPLVPREFFDTEAGVGCQDAVLDGEHRCAPVSDSRLTGAFADAGCTELAVAFNPNAGACDAPPDVPHYVALMSAVDAPAGVEIGERIATAFREDAGGTCSPYEATGETSLYRATPLDPRRLSILTTKTE